MKIIFNPLKADDAQDVIDIFNYYIINSFAAYADKSVSESFFETLLQKIGNYPAYLIYDDDKKKTAGFCFLKPHHPFSVFQATAEITYFIAKSYTGKSIGRSALNLLETEAKKLGIKTILASISSLNEGSIRFHEKNGFQHCGRFKKIGLKHDTVFDVVWMQKFLD